MTYSYNAGVDYSGHSQMIVTQLKVCFRFRGKLFGRTDPPNNTLFVGTVPPNNAQFGGTVPPNCILFGRTPDPCMGTKNKDFY